MLTSVKVSVSEHFVTIEDINYPHGCLGVYIVNEQHFNWFNVTTPTDIDAINFTSELGYDVRNNFHFMADKYNDAACERMAEQYNRQSRLQLFMKHTPTSVTVVRHRDVRGPIGV